MTILDTFDKNKLKATSGKTIVYQPIVTNPIQPQLNLPNITKVRFDTKITVDHHQYPSTHWELNASNISAGTDPILTKF